MGRRTFQTWITLIVLAVVAQSVGHLVLAMWAERPRTLLDVEHSNGVPDLVSSVALAVAALGVVAVARRARGADAAVALLAASLLAALTLADLLHDGAHPSSGSGVLVVGLVAATAVTVGLVGLRGSRRCRVTLLVAASLLMASFAASGIDRFEAFEGRRGEAVKELRLVSKEGLELAGWALVALALWDEALRRRRASPEWSAHRAEPGGPRDPRGGTFSRQPTR